VGALLLVAASAARRALLPRMRRPGAASLDRHPPRATGRAPRLWSRRPAAGRGAVPRSTVVPPPPWVGMRDRTPGAAADRYGRAVQENGRRRSAARRCRSLSAKRRRGVRPRRWEPSVAARPPPTSCAVRPRPLPRRLSRVGWVSGACACCMDCPGARQSAENGGGWLGGRLPDGQPFRPPHCTARKLEKTVINAHILEQNRVQDAICSPP